MAEYTTGASELSELQTQVDRLAAEVRKLQQRESGHRKLSGELQRFNELLIGMWNELCIDKPSKLRAMSQVLATNARFRPFGLVNQHYRAAKPASADEGDESDESDGSDGSTETINSVETKTITLFDPKIISREYTSGDDVLLVQYMDHDEMVRIAYCTAEGVSRSEWAAVVSNDKVNWKRLCEKSCPDSFTKLESGWIIGWAEGVFRCRSAAGGHRD